MRSIGIIETMLKDLAHFRPNFLKTIWCTHENYMNNIGTTIRKEPRELQESHIN
jgi:hypothetical protein